MRFLVTKADCRSLSAIVIAALFEESPIMTNRRNKVVGLGEILWDMLPEAKKLGGAPANFAYISTLLGDEGVVASPSRGRHVGQRGH